MLGLVAQALIGLSAMLVLGGLIELHTAWRYSRLKRGKLTDVDDVEVEVTVEADGGVLQAPLSRAACVIYTLVLSRERVDKSGHQAIYFLEQRPFFLIDDTGRKRLDPKKAPVVVLGSDVTERPLPFLPQAVLAHLVQQFGHLGHMWAEDYVVTGRESCVKDGARLYALLKGGTVRTLASRPLRQMGRESLGRGLKALAIAAPMIVVALWLRSW